MPFPTLLFFLSAMRDERATRWKKCSRLAVTRWKRSAKSVTLTPSAVPVAAFFEKPAFCVPRLSPDGESVAFLGRYRGRLHLWVQDVVRQLGPPRRVSDAIGRDVVDFRWVTNEHLVYLCDDVAPEDYRLYGVCRDGSGGALLTPFAGVRCLFVDGDGTRIRGRGSGTPTILVQMDLRIRRVYDLCRVAVDSGEITIVARNPGFVRQWVASAAGEVVLTLGSDENGAFLLRRVEGSERWQTVCEYEFGEVARPLFFSGDETRLFVSSNAGRDTAALCRLDLETGEETIVFEDQRMDVERASYSPNRDVLEYAEYEADGPKYRFFDTVTRDRFDFAREALAGAGVTNVDVAVCSRSADENKWIVHAGRRNWRGVYYFVDHPAGAVAELGRVRPGLPDILTSVTESIRFRARDGLRIPGYLTVPSSRRSRRLPLVVLLHGGPWRRDSAVFNAEVEFLASRGYGVLRVNYRGSRGFGRRFLEAGFRQWGLRIQDDITDAVLWAIETGVADPGRVGVYGSSFGGYAALCGLAKTPELYACGACFAGISNLLTWLGDDRSRWGPYGSFVRDVIGDPLEDEARLRLGSPLYFADRIRAPLLLGHGKRDPRVPVEETRQLVEQLRRSGRCVTSFVVAEEGHGLQSEESRFGFYDKLETFLRENLRGSRPDGA